MKIEQKLLSIPIEIQELEEKILKSTQTLEDEKEEVELTIAKMEIEIVEERDLITKKPMYSNEMMRKNQLKLRMSEDKKLKNSLQHIKTEQNAIKLDTIELECKKRLFRAFESLAGLGIQEVNKNE